MIRVNLILSAGTAGVKNKEEKKGKHSLFDILFSAFSGEENLDKEEKLALMSQLGSHLLIFKGNKEQNIFESKTALQDVTSSIPEMLKTEKEEKNLKKLSVMDEKGIKKPNINASEFLEKHKMFFNDIPEKEDSLNKEEDVKFIRKIKSEVVSYRQRNSNRLSLQVSKKVQSNSGKEVLEEKDGPDNIRELLEFSEVSGEKIFRQVSAEKQPEFIKRSWVLNHLDVKNGTLAGILKSGDKKVADKSPFHNLSPGFYVGSHNFHRKELKSQDVVETSQKEVPPVGLNFVSNFEGKRKSVKSEKQLTDTVDKDRLSVLNVACKDFAGISCNTGENLKNKDIFLAVGKISKNGDSTVSHSNTENLKSLQRKVFSEKMFMVKEDSKLKSGEVILNKSLKGLDFNFKEETALQKGVSLLKNGEAVFKKTNRIVRFPISHNKRINNSNVDKRFKIVSYKEKVDSAVSTIRKETPKLSDKVTENGESQAGNLDAFSSAKQEASHKLSVSHSESVAQASLSVQKSLHKEGKGFSQGNRGQSGKVDVGNGTKYTLTATFEDMRVRASMVRKFLNISIELPQSVFNAAGLSDEIREVLNSTGLSGFRVKIKSRGKNLYSETFYREDESSSVEIRV